FSLKTFLQTVGENEGVYNFTTPISATNFSSLTVSMSDNNSIIEFYPDRYHMNAYWKIGNIMYISFVNDDNVVIDFDNEHYFMFNLENFEFTPSNALEEKFVNYLKET